ncbi:MAG: hypothetical protein JWM27_3466 [Gemmatimonadetes bacterium]|nr:hypothetical protein [Gemmatimonadota bacterium]
MERGRRNDGASAVLPAPLLRRPEAVHGKGSHPEIFTEPELASAQAYAMPGDEQVHFEWVHTTVRLLACVSDALEARVERAFLDGAAPAQRQSFRDSVASVPRLVAARRLRHAPAGGLSR